jgi:sucrose-6-phosphate hydrolase SacC (GH32 family)
MSNFPLVKNSNRFVWDFWYWYDTNTASFHLLYLNADYELVPGNQHHFSARIGYAITKDFTEIDWIDDDVFCANHTGWDNTSIWSGDLVRHNDGFILFYTSRNNMTDDGMTQYIGAAYSNNFLDWKRLDGFVLKADPRWYDLRSLKGDSSIHAWRDPFIFRDNDKTWMLLCAKEHDAALGHKGAVALLHAEDSSLMNWSIHKPLFSPGWYSECEVPQIYLNEAGQKVLVYSSWARFDNAPTTNGVGGLHAVILGDDKPWVLVPESEGLYACRVIPELGGDVVGFDILQGGLRRLGITTGLHSMK